MNKKLREILDYILIIVFVILLKAFIITPAIVKQQSMQPTLFEKDIVIVDKINKINRFDIVIFKREKDFLIKRVIGMPGDHIKYEGNKLFINEKEYEEKYLKEGSVMGNFEIEEKIPDNKYFVLGDNRNNSIDSRTIGYISKEEMVGKTNLIIFPFKHFGIINKK